MSSCESRSHKGEQRSARTVWSVLEKEARARRELKGRTNEGVTHADESDSHCEEKKEGKR